MDLPLLKLKVQVTTLMKMVTTVYHLEPSVKVKLMMNFHYT